MYSGTLRKQVFSPDPTSFRHAEERERYIQQLKEGEESFSEKTAASTPEPVEKIHLSQEPKSLAQLLEMISPEDSALIALVVFLLCDNTENDVVLLGILLYVLLSK